MSAPDVEERRDYGSIIVVGGGCYGGYYVRQLSRALRAGAITARRVVVVDRDPACAVASTLAEASAETRVAFDLLGRDWREFFAEYLAGAAMSPEHHQLDAIVPSPLMPHLMGEWLVSRAREEFGARVRTAAFDRVPSVPWDRAGDIGTHYVSFATWMCPINCVEPRTCPHTKSARDWSLPVRIAAHTREARSTGERLEDAVLFCRHRAYGVGMFDTAEVLRADERIRSVGMAGSGEVIIGTVSHCHGALTRLVIDPTGEPINSAVY